MHMTTRRISETERLEDLNDTTNIVVEDGGALKRFPAKAVGKVKTVNNVEPDETGNIAIEIPEGFSGRWKDMIDRPFGEIDSNNVLHSGAITSMPKINNYFGGSFPSVHYRLGDCADWANGAEVTAIINGVTYNGVVTGKMIPGYTTYTGVYFTEPGGPVIYGIFNDPYGDFAEQAGLIFATNEQTNYTLELFIPNVEIKTLDTKFIPDTIARKTDIPDIPEPFSGRWNDLIDRPFGDKTGDALFAIRFNSDRTIKFHSVWNGNGSYQAITDYYVTIDELKSNGVFMVENRKYWLVKYDKTEGACGTYQVFSSYDIDVFTVGTDYHSVFGIQSIDFNTNTWTGDTMSWNSTDSSWGKVLYVVPYDNYGTDLIDEKFLPKAAAVADVTEAPTAEQFNALLASLRAAGYLAQ